MEYLGVKKKKEKLCPKTSAPPTTNVSASTRPGWDSSSCSGCSTSPPWPCIGVSRWVGIVRETVRMFSLFAFAFWFNIQYRFPGPFSFQDRAGLPAGHGPLHSPAVRRNSWLLETDVVGNFLKRLGIFELVGKLRNCGNGAKGVPDIQIDLYNSTSQRRLQAASESGVSGAHVWELLLLMLFQAPFLERFLFLFLLKW